MGSSSRTLSGKVYGAKLTLIACTGADDATMRRVIDAGFDHVFRKPAKIERLLDVVRDASGSDKERARYEP